MAVDKKECGHRGRSVMLGVYWTVTIVESHDVSWTKHPGSSSSL